MRFLACSDIHNNLSAVQALRAREANNYDAIVVAGDLGSDKTQPIFDILRTFECPVLFVLGNWDGGIEYGHIFGEAVHHLHLAPHDLGGLHFVGLSGLPHTCGHNPIFAALCAEVDARHAALLRRLTEADVDEARGREEANRRFEADKAELDAKTTDRRKRSYHQKLKRLQSRHADQLSAAGKALLSLRESKAFTAYNDDLATASRQSQIANRLELSRLVGRLNVSQTVVVTHDRLSNTESDFPGIPLFLFGHRHGFKDTAFRGSRFVNVSALDNKSLFARSIKDSSYAIITYDQHGFSVEPRRLHPDEGDSIQVRLR